MTQYIIAILWGFAEATFFFFIPDIYLTRIALFDFRKAIIACLFTAISACVGGALMYWWGDIDFQQAVTFLQFIPGIFPGLIQLVMDNVNTSPFFHVFTAPLSGIPYKIYAVAFGAKQINFSMFLLVSFFARLLRFLMVTLMGRLIFIYARRHWDFKKILYAHIYIWGMIYSFYFIFTVYLY